VPESCEKLTAGQTSSLTAGMAAGDARAVELFYRRYFDWLYAQARLATRRDESFCLDVVQDAVLRIVRSVRTVGSEAQFRAWLRLVVQTVAWDKLRSESRRTQRELVIASIRTEQTTLDEPADESQQAWLEQQIARLDPQLVTMIEMRYEQNWTLGRIAKALGLSIGTIDGRLRRALKQLRDRAVEDFDE
jgi:RNA polymerase sigma-70 factor (ECF subfamily)